MKHSINIILFLLLQSTYLFAQPGELLQIATSEKRAFDQLNKQVAAVLPNNYDLKYGRMEWKVNPALKFIDGKVTYLFFHADSMQEFKLELSDSLVTDSVQMNGNHIAFTHLGNILTANFGQYLSAAQLDSISIYYHGVPPSSGFGSFAAETHGPNNIPVLWTLSQPYGAKDWWPAKQDLNDKIDSVDIYVIAPSTYKAASNGVLVSEIINGTDKITYWKHRYPIAAYLIAIAVSDYTVFTNQVALSNGTLDVVNYVYNESLGQAQLALNEMNEHLVFFDSLFIPYPFMNEKYGHAQFNWGGGMEHQTISFVGGFSYELLAHELAHMWFGDHVTCGSWQDLWLNEGFATYATGLCYERFSPNLYWKIWKANQVDFITSSPDGSVFVTDTSTIARLFDARLTYSKAAMLLHMIRWKIGDDDFFEALRNYQNNPLLSHNYARNIDLKNEFEWQSQQNLDELFNDWYWGEGYPSYTLNYDQDNSNLVTFTLSQSQSHPSVGFFEMPVPIRFKNATQDTMIVFEHMFSGQSFFAQLSFKVDSIIIDPDNWIVCNQNVIASTQNTPPSNQGILLFPNPASEKLHLIIKGQLAERIQEIQIFSVDGQEVTDKVFYTTNATNGIIEINNLSQGIYQLRVNTQKNNYNLTFVKP
jgi:aminopeptidase N